jgi:drug/metabolite transporter (DMT)-like permease
LVLLPDHLPSAQATIALAVLGIVCTGFTLTLFYSLIARAGPARAALAYYLSPGVAVVLGWLFLGEHVTASTALGLVAIVVGSALAAPPGTDSSQPHP